MSAWVDAKAEDGAIGETGKEAEGLARVDRVQVGRGDVVDRAGRGVVEGVGDDLRRVWEVGWVVGRA